MTTREFTPPTWYPELTAQRDDLHRVFSWLVPRRWVALFVPKDIRQAAERASHHLLRGGYEDQASFTITLADPEEGERVADAIMSGLLKAEVIDPEVNGYMTDDGYALNVTYGLEA